MLNENEKENHPSIVFEWAIERKKIIVAHREREREKRRR